MELTYSYILNYFADKYGYNQSGKYLEIGVRSLDNTFNKVRMPIKVGIDIDPSVGATYTCSSEHYFREIVGDQKFSLIFQDGDHRKETALADSISSLEHLEEGGIILCDDCGFLDTDPPWMIEDRFCSTAFAAFGELRKRKDLVIKGIEGTRCGLIKKGINENPVDEDFVIEPTFEFFHLHKDKLFSPILWSKVDLYF